MEILAKLLQELESHIASVKSASRDVIIIDVTFFLPLLVDPPSSKDSGILKLTKNSKTSNNIAGCLLASRHVI